MTVTALDPPDIRKAPIYRIDIVVDTEDGQQVSGITHRTYSEFQKLDSMVSQGINYFT